MTNIDIKKEKAYLVCPYLSSEEADYMAKELELLSESALLEVVKINIFQPKEINARTYIGVGKVEMIRDEVAELGVDVVIFDCPLSGSQLRNLAEIIGVKTIDRTMLILDIFAGRAKSGEGKLQVELAQLKYTLPRLATLNLNNEHSGRGVGMRGTGESKLELDKRKVQEDINRLEKEIKEIQKHRQTTRKQRLSRMKSVALVGYTNAGKSTLMNAISKADTYADDRLFATLDVLTKKVWDEGVEYVLIDTVGFVSNLPHELMYAFSATLEETIDANVLLLVVDAGDPHKYEQIEVVEKEFERLGVDLSRVILVYNKVDKLTDEEIGELKSYPYDTCYISAKCGNNMVVLKQMIRQKISIFGNY
ncbi:MAG: GTPase HflX [Clostridiales bacterium]|nr:GTPase HflX [Clostridiales bacterium]